MVNRSIFTEIILQYGFEPTPPPTPEEEESEEEQDEDEDGFAGGSFLSDPGVPGPIYGS